MQKKKRIDRYIVGNNMPPWMYGKLMPYKKMDGQTGYEFNGKMKYIELKSGDIITRCGGRYEIEMR